MKAIVMEDERFVSKEELKEIGVLYYKIDIPEGQRWQDHKALAAIRKERAYSSADEIHLVKENVPEDKLKMFFDEHLHDDEEIRLVLKGSGYFDVRNLLNQWIRIHVHSGDLIVLPAGMYHRFALDDQGMIHAVRLFQEEPKWIAHSRALKETDQRESRSQYLQQCTLASKKTKAPSSSDIPSAAI